MKRNNESNQSRLAITEHHEQGDRPTMEDASTVHTYDVSQLSLADIGRVQQTIVDTLQSGFNTTKPTSRAGTTFVSAAILGNQLQVSFLGDSECAVVRRGPDGEYAFHRIIGREMMHDPIHNPNEAEIARLNGGKVAGNGRLAGLLAMTRDISGDAFQSMFYSPGFNSNNDPNVQVNPKAMQRIDQMTVSLANYADDDILVIGCDGITDSDKRSPDNSTPNLNAQLNEVANAGEPITAETVVQAALDSGSGDNVSAIVVSVGELRRAQQQDPNRLVVLTVFDGHGGAEVAEYCAEEIDNVTKQQINMLKQQKQAQATTSQQQSATSAARSSVELSALPFEDDEKAAASRQPVNYGTLPTNAARFAQEATIHISYMADVDRDEAEKRLSGMPDGTYLLRPSSKPDTLAISVVHGGAVKNVQVSATNEGLMIQGDKNVYSSVDAMVSAQRALSQPLNRATVYGNLVSDDEIKAEPLPSLPQQGAPAYIVEDIEDDDDDVSEMDDATYKEALAAHYPQDEKFSVADLEAEIEIEDVIRELGGEEAKADLGPVAASAPAASSIARAQPITPAQFTGESIDDDNKAGDDYSNAITAAPPETLDDLADVDDSQFQSPEARAAANADADAAEIAALKSRAAIDELEALDSDLDKIVANQTERKDAAAPVVPQDLKAPPAPATLANESSGPSPRPGLRRAARLSPDELKQVQADIGKHDTAAKIISDVKARLAVFEEKFTKDLAQYTGKDVMGMLKDAKNEISKIITAAVKLMPDTALPAQIKELGNAAYQRVGQAILTYGQAYLDKARESQEKHMAASNVSSAPGSAVRSEATPKESDASASQAAQATANKGPNAASKVGNAGSQPEQHARVIGQLSDKLAELKAKADAKRGGPSSGVLQVPVANNKENNP